jgi:catechol 2,3-dioxygenase-like lactoylglutathione lyase family enzyme
MFSNAKIMPTIPVTDIDRARDFYEGLLGLDVYMEDEEQGSVLYESAGTRLLVYQRATASSGEHTVASFQLEDDFDDAIDYLLDNGITFDTFEMPGMDLPWDDRGVLSDGQRSTAWFKDPDGNVLAVGSGF